MSSGAAQSDAVITPGRESTGAFGYALPMAPRTERKMTTSGSRLALIGLPLVVIGLTLALLLDGTASGIGLAIVALGTLPVLAGVVLLLSSGVEGRSRKGKPYA